MGSRASDPNSIYFYDPSFPLCIVAAVLYLIPAIILLYLTCVRYKSWYFICVPIGCFLETAGYIARAVSVKNVESIVRTPSQESDSCIVILGGLTLISSPQPPYAVSSSLIVIA